ncbi:MAG: ABC transporter permease [Planctomycetota bacterium]|jgi:ribose transport system permease protein|nr:ABC transporter permease [Planctomycetota bacterium]
MSSQPQSLDARKGGLARWGESLVPAVSLLVVFIPIVYKQPNLLSPERYHALLTMTLVFGIPIALASLGQMLAMSIGEIDFSMENLVSLTTCVIGAVMGKNLALGFALLFGILVVYMLIGAFVHLKKLPSIIITIGMSFIWTGLAITIQPTPGGSIPAPLVAALRLKPPWIPYPVVAAAVLALVGHFLMFKTNLGILARGVGDNVKSIQQAGHSALRVRVAVFGLVGLFGILSGATLAGLTTSADPLLAKNYTLLSVAAVVLGGGAFVGGKVSAAGTVLGAFSMHLVTNLLVALKISTDWQAGVKGIIILLALYIGGFFKRTGKVRYF